MGPGPRDTKEGVREIGPPDCIDECDIRVGPGPLGGPGPRDTKAGVRKIGLPNCIDECDFRMGLGP